MASLLPKFAAVGVQLRADRGNIRARGPLTDDLRATIRANKPALLAELAANDAIVEPSSHAVRRAKALAILKNEPSRRIAIVAEAPKPGEQWGYVCTAIRGVAVGEVAVPAAKYDALALLALMHSHGTA